MLSRAQTNKIIHKITYKLTTPYKNKSYYTNIFSFFLLLYNMSFYKRAPRERRGRRSSDSFEKHKKRRSRSRSHCRNSVSHYDDTYLEFRDPPRRKKTRQSGNACTQQDGSAWFANFGDSQRRSSRQERSKNELRFHGKPRWVVNFNSTGTEGRMGRRYSFSDFSERTEKERWRKLHRARTMWERRRMDVEEDQRRMRNEGLDYEWNFAKFRMSLNVRKVTDGVKGWNWRSLKRREGRRK